MTHRQYFKAFDPLVQFPPAEYCPANDYHSILDANATEADVLATKTFYATEMPKKMGSMPNNADFSDVIELVAEEINPPLGYHNGEGIIKIAPTEQAKIIPGNIKKDVVILGVVGTLDATPSVVCPANGYIPDPYIYTLPVTLPVQPSESILHVCDARKGNWLGATYHDRVTWNTNGGSGVQVVYDLYDASGVFINTRSSGAAYLDFAFPANDRYYTVIQRLSYAPAYFTGYYNNDATIKYNDSCVESVVVNATHIIQFNSAYRANLKSLTFLNNSFNTFIALDDFVKCCISLRKWDFPQKNCPNINSTANMFAYSGLVNPDYHDIVIPNGTYSDSWFYGSRFAQNVIMPTTMYGNRFGSQFRDTSRLISVVMPTSFVFNGTPNNNMASMFQNSVIEGEVIISASYPTCTIAQSIIQNAKNITIFRMKGDWRALTNFSSALNGCTSLVTFEAPRISNLTTKITGVFDTTITKLRYFIAPDTGLWEYPQNDGLISITGDQDTSGFAIHPVIDVMNTNYTMQATLAVFNAPKLRVSKFTLGYNASYKFNNVTTLNIDWANSSYAGASPQILIAANLSAAELNRIMGLLPSVAKTIDIRYCTGYATCDKTIAQAKGWTVL